jgi:pimeloyl-ACP methyl ester carboxylesterase
LRLGFRSMRAAVSTALLLLAIVATSCSTGGEGVPERTGPFRAELQQTPAGGSPIAWYVRGEGPPLVLLTGTASTLAEWDPALLGLLAAEHRLIMLDYPGLGHSGPWRGRSFDSLADQVDALLERIGVERAAVLGWSMGGFVAQRLAVRHPDRISHLVLAGTNPGGPAAVLGTRRAQRIDSDPDPSIGQILGLLYPRDQLTEGRSFLRRVRRAAARGEIPDDFRVPAATVRAQVAAEGPWLRSNRNARQLARVEVPTLVAAGRRDPVTPPINSRRLARRIPGAQLRVFAGAHAFLFQHRDRFAAAVAELTAGPDAAG